jgi:hypothetical protein
MSSTPPYRRHPGAPRTRLSVGDLRQYGLTPPAEGIFTRLRREGKAPAIIDQQVIQAIRIRRIEITAGITFRCGRLCC